MISVIIGVMWSLIVAGSYVAAWSARDPKTTDSIWTITGRGMFHWGWWFLGAAGLVVVVTWYRLIPRRLARDSATIGMRQLGIVAREAKSGLPIGPARAYSRSFGTLLIGLAAQVGVIAITWDLYRWHPKGASSGHPTHLVPTFAEPSTSTLFWRVVISVALLYGPTLVYFITRRRQTLADVLTGVVLTVERDTNWWSVAAFGTLIIWPVSLVLGHVALFTSHRSQRGRTGRGLALGALLCSYLGPLVIVAIIVAIPGAGPEASAAQQRTLAALLPAASTLPPDLVRIPTRPAAQYPDIGCQTDVLGDPVASAEVRYAGAQEAASGLPVGLDVWVGRFEHSADVRKRVAGWWDRCSFSLTSDASSPQGISNLVGTREVVYFSAPYRIGSGAARQTVTLHAAVASVGHYVMMVLGANQDQVNQLGTALVAELP